MKKRYELLRWKEFGDKESPSITTAFNDGPYFGQKEIVKYLKTAGTPTVCAPANTYDVFTHEMIMSKMENWTDGEYSWPCELYHYVEKYNMRLPKDFEDKVFAIYGIKRDGQR